jgi:hypothetical protein
VLQLEDGSVARSEQKGTAERRSQTRVTSRWSTPRPFTGGRSPVLQVLVRPLLLLVRCLLLLTLLHIASRVERECEQVAMEDAKFPASIPPDLIGAAIRKQGVYGARASTSTGLPG